MKRSEIQKEIKWAGELLKKHCFYLPEFAEWTLGEWKKNAEKIDVIRATMRGWDITDYGMGDFKTVGSVLFTLRNGVVGRNIGTPYAEKVIPLHEGQRLPMHFHAVKTEDIINRGGGMMYMKLYNALPDGEPDREGHVNVSVDGILKTIGAGEEFLVGPGSSVSLTPRMYHIFGAKQGYGDLIVGEVSSVNDDNTDNYFYEKVSRFAEIEEDEELVYPLCNEYEKVLGSI
ncbi:D-lyxose/D-mannose family sugar isomerase [Christensenella tenuis]|jgi:D-lyxose ketol-isomerase|uniref:D-lyxose ketol-isomerase n=1 Tax=Christensenella tenuis TaxID=2763033 RepID=A0ABR7EE01_9FIRM|nr:D-lyxose/D-mannose family sugar isomerase [Christensenella tenuis]MBC5648011.1 D-lyxose/D-mannose family sugar isomerase [Christensenella tenuis]